MYDSKYVVAGIVIFLALFISPTAFTYAMGGMAKAPEPALPADEKECVESAEYMRAEHMQLLVDWREEVVRNGERTYTSRLSGKSFDKSLTNTCLSCHEDKQDFCDSCHTYTGVTPNCWDCHNVPKESDA